MNTNFPAVYGITFMYDGVRKYERVTALNEDKAKSYLIGSFSCFGEHIKILKVELVKVLTR